MEKEEFYKLIENPQLLKNYETRELHSLSVTYPYFHAALILYLKNLKDSENQEFDQALKKAAPLLPDRKQLYRIINSTPVHSPANYDLEHSSINTVERNGHQSPAAENDLIEKFLKSQSIITISKKQFTENTPEEPDMQVIARSLADDDELVTETLAMIYFNQRKYDRAIEAFRKLSLKYPEKSIYFASQIEEIEKLKNI